MKRISINPWDWGLQYGMDQGEIVEGLHRHLHFSGQISVVPDTESDLGFAVKHAGDIRKQTELSLANIDTILEEAGMVRRNLLSLRIFTTDIDAFLENYDVYAGWIAEAGIRPPQSLIGVARLVLPDIMVEIEATAGQ